VQEYKKKLTVNERKSWHSAGVKLDELSVDEFSTLAEKREDRSVE